MGVRSTVVFTDLHGSTAIFESLGNARATETITEITAWVAKLCEQYGGRLIKTLGDGVMVVFAENSRAVSAALEIQRLHYRKTTHMQMQMRLPIRIGISCGDVEMIGGDCYGDAVNVAARLCDLCGPHQIWVNSNVVDGLAELRGMSVRMLGPIHVRGRAEPCEVHQIEWREEEQSDFLTMQAPLIQDHPEATDVLGREIHLDWMDSSVTFRSFEMPVQIGRVKSAGFVVNDPRVSRTHAKLEWHNGGIAVVDLSTYGTWVRFSGGRGGDVLLRRNECVLHGNGMLALGGSFSDPTVPTIRFQVK